MHTRWALQLETLENCPEGANQCSLAQLLSVFLEVSITFGLEALSGQQGPSLCAVNMSSCVQVKEKGPPEHPLWTLRTKEEAQEFWEQEFGHLRREQQASAAGQPPQKTDQEQRPRSFVASGDVPTSAAAITAAVRAYRVPKPEEARLQPGVPAPD